jgi:hypothetical protein
LDGICDDAAAAFIRRCDGEQDVLVVMNLRGDPVEKDLSGIANSLKLAAVLNTDEMPISFEAGILILPAYSIAILTPEA